MVLIRISPKLIITLPLIILNVMYHYLLGKHAAEEDNESWDIHLRRDYPFMKKLIAMESSVSDPCHYTLDPVLILSFNRGETHPNFSRVSLFVEDADFILMNPREYKGKWYLTLYPMSQGTFEEMVNNGTDEVYLIPGHTQVGGTADRSLHRNR